MSKSAQNLQYQDYSMQDNSKFLDQSQISLHKSNYIQQNHDQTFQLANPYSNRKIESSLNYPDLMRDGEQKRQNIFLQQDSSLYDRNVKVFSQTVFDLASDIEGNNLNKDQFEQGLHRIFDSKQGNQKNNNDSDLLNRRSQNKLTIDAKSSNEINNSYNSKNNGSNQLLDYQNENISPMLKIHKTKKHATQVPTNFSQKEINLQIQNQQPDNNSSGYGGNLMSQLVSKMSQKHSSYAISYSSNQNESQVITNRMNESSQGSNNGQNINYSQKLELNTINIQTDKGRNLLTASKNDSLTNNLIAQDIPSSVANNLNNNQKVINQPLLNDKEANDTNDQAFEELQKKKRSRMSVVQQSTVNKFSFKFFKKANMIKKFIQTMVSQLPSKVFQKLEYRHFNIIGDAVFQFNNMVSDDEIIFKKQLQKSKTQHKLSTVGSNIERAISNRNQYSFTEQFPIIQPNGIFLVFWNIFFLFFLLIQLVIIPLLCVYDQAKDTQPFMFITEPLAVTVFIIQMLLNMNTGFYNEGEIVKSRLQIFKKYLRFYLWIDLITIFTIIACMQNQDIQFIKLIYLLRIIQVLQLLNTIEEHFQLQQKYYTIYELTKLYTLIYFVAHYSSCIFYLISKLDYQNNPDISTWIKNIGVTNEYWTVIYLDSIYFSFVTMVTVGFGDIVPKSSHEKIYVTFFSVVSCGIFGYAVNTIGSIFHELSQKQANYKLKKFEITQYMEGRQIQRASQIKVLKYLEYMNSQEEERNYLCKGELILSGISKNLREEIYQDFFGKILFNSNIFKNNFSNKLIQQLSLVMKEITLGPGDIIFNKGDTDNRLYYVFKGAVENTLEINNQIIKFGQYMQGEFFGQSGFFADIPRYFTAKSKGTTHIVYCKREDMLKLIQENPSDKEQFAMCKDEILFKQNICGHKCLSCLKPGHIEEKCNYINIKINKPLLIVKNNFSLDQHRCTAERQIKKKYNAIKKYIVTKKLLKQLRVTCVLEAVEQWDDLAILQDNKITDKEFFMRMPKVSYSEANQCMQETGDSLYSGDEEDIQFFSKEDYKGSQDLVQGLSEMNPTSNINITNNKNQNRVNLRHQTHKLSIKNEEFSIDKQSISRSKTKKETYAYSSPTQVNKRFQQLDLNLSSSQQGLFFPSNQQENNVSLQRQNSQKTARTMQRHDSSSSINSYQDTFKRNASRNLSHFGTQAQTAQYINLQIASNMMAAKQYSDTKIESPRNRSNLSAFNPKPQDNKQDQKLSSLNAENADQQKQIQQNQQFEDFFIETIENDFDFMKEYTVYYPQNNISQVLRQIRKIWLEKFSKKRAKTKHSQKTTQKSKKDLNKSIKKSETKITQKTNQQLQKIETKNTQKTFTNYNQSFMN
ncbi:cyclic nucleotide-binding domain protein (macronuclear) [Tetrahymena thermophila SB210]|uniref:Cyclic nucleotide-binding domain protein n=1 Tax=Tetrahymena thermophila (strain SB210) TaxID=312017 RepID=Q22FY5_TETTS|nr:cyclic nucleotide-binding domain protein [Tetrahymena thermophila SB210]EAR84241.2 cyclic nucleotide-binding domain protein [Tetrahymena thermophila SB210]|eukprot:XP_001031904.2 cyclic nucleotide-binding domain protein [Tetrahymena thermophila SB210]